MDVKAMARSKRSHTKQHQPRKPHRPNTQPVPTPTKGAPPPSSAAHDAKSVKAEAGKKSSLPSNWDRYDDSDEDDTLFGSASESAPADVVKPKSKGADFAFLVSEAKSQSLATFPDSLDHLLPDFYEGLGPMLSARGENVLSWTGGDDFFLEEDEATTNQEVPFLSLNLHTLAEELGRMDLAKRLFIEQDILPPELRALPKIERDDKRPVSTSVEQSSEVDDNLTFQKSSKVEKRIMSKEGRSVQQDSVDTTLRAPLSLGQERQLDDILADHKSNSFRVFVPKESFKATQETEINNKIPRFEAGAAEAELDMLLGSFDETQFFGSSNTDSNVPSNNVSAHLAFSTSSFTTNSMDNDIDDLLQETSNITVGHASSHSIEVNADTTGKQLSSSSHPSTKSKVMEDFDSWLDTI